MSSDLLASTDLRGAGIAGGPVGVAEAGDAVEVLNPCDSADFVLIFIAGIADMRCTVSASGLICARLNPSTDRFGGSICCFSGLVLPDRGFGGLVRPDLVCNSGLAGIRLEWSCRFSDDLASPRLMSLYLAGIVGARWMGLGSCSRAGGPFGRGNQLSGREDGSTNDALDALESARARSVIEASESPRIRCTQEASESARMRFTAEV